MNRKRFHPDIKRNVLVTNWVASKSEPQQSKRTRHSHKRSIGLIILGAFAISLFSVTIYVVQQGSKNPHQVITAATTNMHASSSSTANSNAQQPACDEVTLKRLLLARDSGGDTGWYTRGATIELGGLRIENYSCVAADIAWRYSAAWLRVGTRWELKKISQLAHG